MAPPPDDAIRAARRFGLLALPLPLAGAALALRARTGSDLPVLLAAAAAIGSAALAWRAPARLVPVHRVAARAGRAAAAIATGLLLGAVYFTAFTAAAIVSRLVGYDAMGRRRDPSARSYWVARPPAPEALERWFEQH